MLKSYLTYILLISAILLNTGCASILSYSQFSYNKIILKDLPENAEVSYDHNIFYESHLNIFGKRDSKYRLNYDKLDELIPTTIIVRKTGFNPLKIELNTTRSLAAEGVLGMASDFLIQYGMMSYGKTKYGTNYFDFDGENAWGETPLGLTIHASWLVVLYDFYYSFWPDLGGWAYGKIYSKRIHRCSLVPDEFDLPRNTYNKYLTIFTKSNKELFKLRSEFETQENYEKRIQNRIAKRNTFIKEKIRLQEEEERMKREMARNIELKKENEKKIRIQKSLTQVNLKIESISKYNADEATFNIKVKNKQYRIKVSNAEARAFKENFKKTQVTAFRRLKNDLKSYEYFNLEATHPTTGSLYQFGPQNNSLNDITRNTPNKKSDFTPPKLEMKIEFKEQNGNKFLDANETGQFEIEIMNSGKGDAFGVVLNLTNKRNNKSLSFEESIFVGTLKSGESKFFKSIIKADKDVERLTNKFTISATESYGFTPEDLAISFDTYPYQSPDLKLVDINVKSPLGNQISPGVVSEITLRIRNQGPGIARDISFTINLPSNIFLNKDSQRNFKFERIEPGEYKDLIFECIPNKKIGKTFELAINFNEQNQSGKIQHSFEINKPQSKIEELVYQGVTDNTQVEAYKPQFQSDVDIDIPSTNEMQAHTYALIIGNEDYSTYQTDLSSEVNVDFAIHDAQIFKSYCEKTLGIPSKQIKLLTNATYGQMSQGVEWIKNLADVENGSAKLIFYYSGHGLPNEQTKQGYLIPVDVSGNNVKNGIALKEVYDALSEFPSERATVFLDACFSGGARNESLVAMKGLKIRPKEEEVSGNTVVFASSSGNESSAVYREKQHGYFTYYLLKKLQESKGEVDYKTLDSYINYQVKKATGINGKVQNPQCTPSSEIEGQWGNWKLK